MKAQNPIEKVKIFVASSSELKEEREKIILIVNLLMKDISNLYIEPVEWETDIVSGSYDGKSYQDVIDEKLKQSHIVLVLFYSKIGDLTQHEFELALSEKKKVFLYFKTGFVPKNTIEAKTNLDVFQFKEEIEKQRKILFKEYATIVEFEKIVVNELRKYLIEEFLPSVRNKIEQEATPVFSIPSVRDVLLDRSRQYYKALRGPNGRFRFLNISEVILPSFTKSVWFDTPVSIDLSGKGFSGVQGAVLQKSPLADAIPALWKNKVKHTVIVGDGGMGKTVTLIHLWEKLLKEDRHDRSSLTPEEALFPIPIFIALNQLNQVPESKRDGFILETIQKDYQLEEISIQQIESLMRTPLEEAGEFIPSVVLLLDGFNEITVEKRPLLIELNRLTEQYPHIQVVMTSRSDMRGNFNWSHWNLVNLQLLDEEKVTQYLNQRNMPIPGQGRLLMLLGNPMMLTLYAASCEIQTRLSSSVHCCFKEKVETPGELLWNFIQAQVGNLPEKIGHDQRLIHKYKFLLMYFLPALGFEMEKAWLFDFKNHQIDACIDLICDHFSEPHFLDSLTQFDQYIDALPIRECANPIEQKKRNGELKKIFTHELHMLVDDGQSFRFLHQNFRDFFAALHILNEMEVAIKNKQIPYSLKERVLDCFVRKYIGEIEGEHSAKPYIDEEKKVWRIDINKENRLFRVLELCRDKFGEAVGYATWNIVEIWKEVRGELTGADLTRLDLTTVQLNAVRCSRSYNETYLAAVFD